MQYNLSKADDKCFQKMLERSFLWNMGTKHESAEVPFLCSERVAAVGKERYACSNNYNSIIIIL